MVPSQMCDRSKKRVTNRWAEHKASKYEIWRVFLNCLLIDNLVDDRFHWNFLFKQFFQNGISLHFPFNSRVTTLWFWVNFYPNDHIEIYHQLIFFNLVFFIKDKKIPFAVPAKKNAEFVNCAASTWLKKWFPGWQHILWKKTYYHRFSTVPISGWKLIDWHVSRPISNIFAFFPD